MIDYNLVKPILDSLIDKGIQPIIKKDEGFYGRAAQKRNSQNPKQPIIFIKRISDTNDLVHELCHCFLESEGYPRTHTSPGFTRSEILASLINGVVEHGRLVLLGKEFGFDLKLNHDQMTTMENRLKENRLDPVEIEACNYADLVIRCSDPEWLERMENEFYKTKYNDIQELGNKLLNDVKRFNGCLSADEARKCFRKIANRFNLNYEMFPKPL